MYRFIFILFFIVAACTEVPVDTGETLSNDFYGTWVEAKEGEPYKLLRASALDSSKGGFIIYEDGTFTERSFGWCGTPPRSYFNHTGTWEQKNDSTLLINFKDFWYKTKDIEILKLTDKKMEIKISNIKM